MSFAIETGSKRGFTIVVSPSNAFESSVEGAQVVAYKNKYMQRAAEWFAVVLVLVDDELDLGAFALDDREWVRDPDLDSVLEIELTDDQRGDPDAQPK